MELGTVAPGRCCLAEGLRRTASLHPYKDNSGIRLTQSRAAGLILSKLQNAWLSNVVFGGKDLDTLYVTCGDKVFKRKIAAKSVVPLHDSFKSPKPRL